MGAILHGGRLDAARRLFPNAPSPFIDLSTGINPFPYPLAPFSVTAFTRLPEPESEEALRHLAASSYGAPSPDNLVAAPGSQILISLLPTLLGCRRAVILSPTYGEHAAAWSLAGATIVRVATITALLAEAGPGVALVVCNPNNPDGSRIDAAMLATLARSCAGHGGVLVVDEAFADLEPDVPQAGSLLPCAGLVVLRSFGKCHGLAGLRLGFMLADTGLAGRMRSLLGAWAVSGPAIEAGMQALADNDWRSRMSHGLEQAARRLDRLLTEGGLAPIGGTRLFRLAETPDEAGLFERLGRAGLLARQFDDQPHRLRFGLPPDEPAWSRLQAAFG